MKVKVLKAIVLAASFTGLLGCLQPEAEKAVDVEEVGLSAADSLSKGALARNTCAIYSGQVKCWGENDYGFLGLGDFNNRGDTPGEMGVNLPAVSLSSTETVLEVSVSNASTYCALLSNGKVKCWGQNDRGYLGTGDLLSRGAGYTGLSEMGDNLAEVNLGTGAVATSISSGRSYNCALLSDGSIKCWGTRMGGVYDPANPDFVGDIAADMGDNLLPVALPGGRHAIAISAGATVTCAILDDNSLYCFGSATSWVPIGAISFGGGLTVKAVSVASTHACAILSDDNVRCWGGNSAGQLGLGSAGGAAQDPSLNVSVDLGSGLTAKAISSGAYHSCAILSDNSLKCWGNAGDGALGLEDSVDRGASAMQMGDNLPRVNLGAGRTALSVSAGVTQTCAILDDQSVKCWGSNGEGRLGLGDTYSRGLTLGSMGDALATVKLW